MDREKKQAIAGRRQSVLAHIKHIETQLVKLRESAEFMNDVLGNSMATETLANIRFATKEFKALWKGDDV